MGIRFRCHHCESELHVKDFQAGKRGRCPECKGKFRIPLSDAERSLPPDGASADDPAPTNSISDLGSPTTEPTAQQQRQPQQPNQPQCLLEAPEAKWYVRLASGDQYGPAAAQTMWQWLQENRIGREALIWREGWAEWLIAASVFDDYFALDLPARMKPPEQYYSQRASSDPKSRETELPDSELPDSESSAQSTQAVPAGTPTPFSEQNRLNRRRNRRRNYAVMIAILSVVMIGLIVALVIVLNTQGG